MGIIFISYALQVKFKPFLPPNNDVLDDDDILSSGLRLVYVRAATATLHCALLSAFP